MLFRILKFRPRPKAGGRHRRGHRADDPAPEAAPARPSPRTTGSSSRGPRSTSCSSSDAPTAAPSGTRPGRRAPTAGRSSGTRSTASGRGTIYSFVVNHYPQVPAFDYPLVVALVELEEGTRLVANVRGITPEAMAIGMPVVAGFEDFDDDLTLPVFRPAPGRPRPTDRDEEALMDFTFDEEQRAVQEAAEGIFAGLVTPERVQEVEAGEDRFDRELWAELAKADLLGLAVPEAYGGGGLRHGRAAPCVLEAQGRVGGAGAAVGHPGPRRHARRRVRVRRAAGGLSSPVWWPATPCSPPP